ncbi:MAG: HIT family protein, partial [bacterium]|nr:HIT family protein [bacterium]
VIPKKHEPDFEKLDENTYSHTMQIVQHVARAIDKAIHPKKVGMFIAGWDVPHTHVHVVPMQDYHDITSKRLLENARDNPDADELNETATKIVQAL